MAMATLTTEQLIQKKCGACEGGVPPMTTAEVAELLPSVPGWTVVRDGQRIRRDWRAKNFLAAIEFFNKVAELAETEGHHPDLHLEGYRNTAIELWTHAIGGLSENDFILAAKINQIPFAVKA
jgi:4a-hydroxytetrahydrobiopterin dehydratase